MPAVLIADPDDAARHAFAESLMRSGCAVDQEEDGRIALARALASPPDLLVAAEHLPGLRGAQLSQVLRGDTLTASIAIIIVNAKEPDVERLQACGADAILVAPSQPQTLTIEAGRLLTRSAELRERARIARRAAFTQLERSASLLKRSAEHHHRLAMSKALPRVQTTLPPIPPPPLTCPMCDRALEYRHSHTGGVNEHQSEQWDYFECPAGCGSFQFRHRTNRVRRITL